MLLAKMKRLDRRDYIFYGAVLALLIIGAILRCVKLEEFPLGVHQDELSNIYDGYSIAKTGADRWGTKYPTILRAFGQMDWRPPMQAWLCALSINIFGFSVFSGRIVSAVLGVASLVLVFLVARKMSGKTFALLALLLVTFSPWHIIFSRLASEATMLPPFFLISACYLWQRAKEKAYSLPSLLLLGLCIGLGTNTYQASKLIFFLFTLLVIVDLFRSTDFFFKKALIFGLSCLLGAGPQLYAAATVPEHFFSRADGSMMAFSWSAPYFNALLKNIALNISPDFLFFNVGADNYFTLARLLTVECLVFYIGLFSIYRVLSDKQAVKPTKIKMMLCTAILPSALTAENPHALRASCLTILLPLITAAGIMLIYRLIDSRLLKRGFLVMAVALVLWNAQYFINYYVSSDVLKQDAMPSLLVKTMQRVNDYKDNYDAVLIERDGIQTYLYAASFCGMTPEQFQAADKQYNAYGWDEFIKLDKYYFLTPDEIKEKAKKEPGKFLIVLHNSTPDFTPVETVNLTGAQMYLYESGAAKPVSVN